MTSPLPTDSIYSKLLSGIVGKNIEVKVTPAYNPKPTDKFSVALYVDDTGKNTVLCIADITLTCALGAILTMVPAGVVKDAISAGEFPEMLLENTKEIYNISTSLFNVKGGPHIKLGSTNTVPPAPTPELTELLAKKCDRADFQVTVPNYGSGMISFRWVG